MVRATGVEPQKFEDTVKTVERQNETFIGEVEHARNALGQSGNPQERPECGTGVAQSLLKLETNLQGDVLECSRDFQELSTVVAAWGVLPEAIRKAIVGMVRAVSGGPVVKKK